MKRMLLLSLCLLILLTACSQGSPRETVPVSSVKPSVSEIAETSEIPESSEKPEPTESEAVKETEPAATAEITKRETASAEVTEKVTAAPTEAPKTTARDSAAEEPTEYTPPVTEAPAEPSVTETAAPETTEPTEPPTEAQHSDAELEAMAVRICDAVNAYIPTIGCVVWPEASCWAGGYELSWRLIARGHDEAKITQQLKDGALWFRDDLNKSHMNCFYTKDSDGVITLNLAYALEYDYVS